LKQIEKYFSPFRLYHQVNENLETKNFRMDTIEKRLEEKGDLFDV
jgi:hypothetical protein